MSKSRGNTPLRVKPENLMIISKVVVRKVSRREQEENLYPVKNEDSWEKTKVIEEKVSPDENNVSFTVTGEHLPYTTVQSFTTIEEKLLVKSEWTKYIWFWRDF